MEKKKLFAQAISKYLLGVILVGTILFLPAWSFSYWNAWLFMGILFVPMFIAGIVMLAYIPIIAKRIRNEEKVLEESLPGYKEYKQKVKYKVIPFIW
jgi:protein-S-isoprenylcysteine O-methyltransferase Ste14